VPAPLRLQRIRDALGDQHEVLPCTSWEDLIAACGRRAITLALVDLFPTPVPAEQPGSFELLRQLKRRYPSVAAVLYTSIPPARPRDFFEAGRFGLDGLVLAEQDDDPTQLRAVVDRAEARGALSQLLPSLARLTPTVRDAVLLSVTRAHQPLSPDDLSRILGVRRKLLSARLTQAGFPTSQKLIAWGRLIVAARLLEDPERTADSVALALDYPSGSAFRNACQRYVRAAPHEIRAQGGAVFVIRLLLEEVAKSAPTTARATPAGSVRPIVPLP
jgi:AraC-like DNA-binding protein